MDREKVLKGLELCVQSGDFCTECPYHETKLCLDNLHSDADALIKEQEETIERYAGFVGKITDPDVDQQACPPPPKGKKMIKIPIEMPSGCEVCPCEYDGMCSAMYSITGECVSLPDDCYFSKEKRADFCPLQEEA